MPIPKFANQEETFAAKAQEHSLALAKRQTCAQQLNQLLNEIRSSLQHAEGQLEALQQQEQELKQTLNKSAEVEAGLAQLLQPHLAHLDQLQLVAQCCSTAPCKLRWSASKHEWLLD